MILISKQREHPPAPPRGGRFDSYSAYDFDFKTTPPSFGEPVQMLLASGGWGRLLGGNAFRQWGFGE
ncbi:MAG: hypothetical protein R6V37_10935 [Psychroflexus maritimus]